MGIILGLLQGSTAQSSLSTSKPRQAFEFGASDQVLMGDVLSHLPRVPCMS